AVGGGGGGVGGGAAEGVLFEDGADGGTARGPGGRAVSGDLAGPLFTPRRLPLFRPPRGASRALLRPRPRGGGAPRASRRGSPAIAWRRSGSRPRLAPCASPRRSETR